SGARFREGRKCGLLIHLASSEVFHGRNRQGRIRTRPYSAPGGRRAPAAAGSGRWQTPDRRSNRTGPVLGPAASAARAARNRRRSVEGACPAARGGQEKIWRGGN